MIDNGNINNCPYKRCQSNSVTVEYDEHEKAFVICRACGARGPATLQPSDSRGQWNDLHEGCYSIETAIGIKTVLIKIVEDDKIWPEEDF